MTNGGEAADYLPSCPEEVEEIIEDLFPQTTDTDAPSTAPPATETPLPEGATPAPADVVATPIPSEVGGTSSPAATGSPAQTAAPGVVSTASPGATSAPAIATTAAPGATLSPGATAAPGATSAPAIVTTAAPGATLAPGATVAPGATSAPAIVTTAAPGATLAPGATAAPGATTAPAPTVPTLAPGKSTCRNKSNVSVHLAVVSLDRVFCSVFCLVLKNSSKYLKQNLCSAVLCFLLKAIPFTNTPRPLPYLNPPRLTGATSAPVATIAPGTTLSPGETWAPNLVRELPTLAPGATLAPSPTAAPSLLAPTVSPFAFTGTPTAAPTESPTAVPTGSPTAMPTGAPTGAPTFAPTGSPTAVPTSSPTVVPTPAATVVDDEPDGSLIGSITIISDEEPECAGAGNCEEVVEDGLESSLGRNGTVNVTDVTVTSTAAAADASRRVLLFVADGDVADNSSRNRLLRGSRQLQEEEAAGNQTETEIEYESSPDQSSNLTEAQQAAEQINALAETGIADLLDEMGLPPDTEVELGVTKFVQREFLVFFSCRPCVFVRKFVKREFFWSTLRFFPNSWVQVSWSLVGLATVLACSSFGTRNGEEKIITCTHP